MSTLNPYTNNHIRHLPRIFLWLASLSVIFTIFDNTWKIEKIPFVQNPSALTTALLAILYSFYFVIHTKNLRLTQIIALIFLVVTFAFELIRVTSPDLTFVSGQYFRSYMQWFNVLVYFIILSEISKDPRSLIYLWGSFIASIFLMVILPYFNSYWMQLHDNRYGFRGVNLNRQAYWYSMGVVTFIWMILMRWPKFKLPELLLSILSLYLLLQILYTGSRGGFLSMVVGFSVIFLHSFKGQRKTAYFILFPIILLISVWLIFDNRALIDRLFFEPGEIQHDTRVLIFNETWNLLKEQPFTGYGPRFVAILGESRGRALAAHNTYMQSLLSFGVFISMIYFYLFFVIVQRCWKFRKTSEGLLFYALVAMSLVHGLVADLAFNKHFWVLLALASNFDERTIHTYKNAFILKNKIRHKSFLKDDFTYAKSFTRF